MSGPHLDDLYEIVFREGDDSERIRQKVCQDVFISKLTGSDFLNAKIVFKGGIVMYELTQGRRGYTKDLDLDFIHMSVSEESVREFIDQMNEADQFPNIRISIASTKPLNHKTYKGRRIILLFVDEKNTEYELSIDIGVHSETYVKPEERPYEIKFSGTMVQVKMDGNDLSIAEKLIPFAIFGISNVRYRDLFDVYWRIKYLPFDKAKIKKVLTRKLIDATTFSSMSEVQERIEQTLRDSEYQKGFENEDNWVREPIESMCDSVALFVASLT